MAIEFVIPNVGDNVNSITIIGWLVEDGQSVEANQEILEAETDKATVAIPSNAGGHIHLGPYNEGDDVPVGTVVAIIGTADERFDSYSSDSPTAPAVAPQNGSTPVPAQPTSPTTTDSLKATPVARKIATELGVKLETISGSGEGGRITKADVQQAAGKTVALVPPQPKPTPAPTPTPVAKPTPSPTSAPTVTVDENVVKNVPLKGIRRIIAERMGESTNNTARVTLVREVDATALVALRTGLKAKYQADWGFAPGYNELLGLICANALREFPFMNARLSADGEAIEYLAGINVGMAVDTERGLLVGVIKDSDQKSLQAFGTEFRSLVKKIRSGKATPDELTGGTFTITNLGMFNVDAFTPVINLPELAILGVGRIVQKPVVIDGEITIRSMWTLSLVFDHRLVDGAPAARFLNHIAELIEDPQLLFLTKR